jgi:hypothetical protein
MSAAKSQPLAGLFTVSIASAAAGFFLRPRVEVRLAPLMKGHEIVPMGIAAYALAFAGVFIVLSFLSHHVSLKFSLKAKGLETTRGLAPRLARALLAVSIFAAPLALPYLHGEKGGVSLKNIIAASDRKAVEAGQGYRSDDRGRLDKLAGEKP